MAEEKDLALRELLSLLPDASDQKEEASGNQEGAKEDGIGLEELISIAGIVSELGSEDARSRLLLAIKPFLDEEKQPKVDTAVKLLKLAKMAETAGKHDLLKKLKL